MDEIQTSAERHDSPDLTEVGIELLDATAASKNCFGTLGCFGCPTCFGTYGSFT